MEMVARKSGARTEGNILAVARGQAKGTDSVGPKLSKAAGQNYHQHIKKYT
jgi:uncharacterized protein YfeS